MISTVRSLATPGILDLVFQGAAGTRLLLDDVLGPGISNGSFRKGAMTGWTATGIGTVEIANVPASMGTPGFQVTDNSSGTIVDESGSVASIGVVLTGMPRSEVVISITNSSYGWTAKLFRVMKVSEIGLPDGNLGATFELNEYNAQVYDDQDITKYIPAPNTDLPDPSYFGNVSAPTIAGSFPFAAVPSFNVQPFMSVASFAAYAEIWYSAFPTPTNAQLFLGGTTSLSSNGVPFIAGQTLPLVNLTIPAGNWYFFTRIVNGVASSQFSPASSSEK